MNADPPKEDKIFKFQYRIMNGTVDEFKIVREFEGVVLSQGIDIKVNSSTSNALLEIKIPRNFPYTNNPPETPSSINDFIFVAKGGRVIEDTKNTTECFFVFSVPVTNSIEMTLASSIILDKSPYHGDKVSESCLSQTVVENVPTKKNGTIRPLYQVRAGVAPEDVLCPEGMEVFVRATDDKPYCVTPPLAEKLIERGWQRKE
ncbi:MAG: hypothetical protein HRF40_13710 [Nitrososphaera sp.]